MKSHLSTALEVEALLKETTLLVLCLSKLLAETVIFFSSKDLDLGLEKHGVLEKARLQRPTSSEALKIKWAFSLEIGRAETVAEAAMATGEAVA